MKFVRPVILGIGFTLAEGLALAAPQKTIAFNVPQQPLSSALNEFARQSQFSIAFFADVTESMQSATVKGSFTPEGALKILLDGADLNYEVKDNSVAIWARKEQAGRGDSQIRLAQGAGRSTDSASSGPPGAAGASPAAADSSVDGSGPSSSTDNKSSMETVVVTGTHLANSETASPTLVFTREDFKRSGASTTQAFLATLPQNFGGTHSGDTAFAGIPGVGTDLSFGNAVNLRGLGAGATLVLVDGKRSAVSGNAEYVDISMIPLSAVERIEIVPDGASAVYGSDAVAGVVNFIMRKDFTGAETQVHAGTTTQGGGNVYDLAQNLGTGWGSGNAWINYTYHKEEPIKASQRDFSSLIDGPLALIPEQKSNLVSLSARQELSSRFALSGSAAYTKRDTDAFTFDIPGTDSRSQYSSRNEEYGASLTLTTKLPAGWHADLTTGASRNKNDFSNVTPSLLDFIGVQLHDSTYDLWYTDFTTTGDLVRIPTGPIKLAFGASYREESYDFSDGESISPMPPERTGGYNVSGVFSELEVPVLRPSAASGGSPLVVTLAGRFDSYSNFGDTFNPKYGVRWTPTPGVKFRASYGTSFKAPTLYQLNPFDRTQILQSVAGTRSVLSVGNSANLHEETAKTWNIGFDLTPASIRGLNAQFSYFDVSYDGRIQSAGVAPVVLLNNPSFASLRVRRGEVSDADFNALVAAALSGQNGRVAGCAPAFRTPDGVCNEPAANFGALLDSSLRNVASTHTQGLDLTAQYAFDLGNAKWTVNANSTYLFEYKRKLTDLAPELEFANTVYFPARLRARLGATREQGGWSVGAFANYTGGYEDNVAVPSKDIASWFTTDLNLHYSTPDNAGWLSAVAVDLNAVNVFDRDPPFFGSNLALALGYDPANADPYGRIVSLTVTKSW